MNKSKCLLILFLFVLLHFASASLNAQPAQIIENIVPGGGNKYPAMVKQGSDGNLYMTIILGQGTGLPVAYKGYLVLSPQGQVLHYYSSTMSEVAEIGFYSQPVFCLESDNSFRIPYFKSIYDTSGYHLVFKWAVYNPQTGYTFTEGFHPITSVFDVLQNVIQLNSDKWIVTGFKSDYKVALCVNSNGDSLWTYQTVNYDDWYHRTKWVKRLADDRLLLAYYSADMLTIKVLDDNGQQVWSHIIGNTGSSVYYTYMTDYYTDDRAIICYQLCTAQTIVTEFYNNTLIELFSPPITLNFSLNANCNSDGFLFTQSHLNSFERYDIQGNILWQYTLPDSFYCPSDNYQICTSVADSCYLITGVKYLGFDQLDEYFLYAPYLLRLPFNLTANDDEVVPVLAKPLQVYPNPFTDRINIRYYSGKVESGQISIYNVKGELVRRYDDVAIKTGTNTLDWDGKDKNNRQVSQGLYVVKIRVGNRNFVSKCLKL